MQTLEEKVLQILDSFGLDVTVNGYNHESRMAFKALIMEALADQRIQLIQEVEGMKQYHETVGYRCAKCRSYGKVGEYCKNDGKKFTDKDRDILQWESMREEGYNKGLYDIIKLIGRSSK